MIQIWRHLLKRFERYWGLVWRVYFSQNFLSPLKRQNYIASQTVRCTKMVQICPITSLYHRGAETLHATWHSQKSLVFYLFVTLLSDKVYEYTAI